MRPDPPRLEPGPGRPAPVRAVPGQRRTRPGHRHSRHRRRPGSLRRAGNRSRCRPPFRSAAFLPAETGMGAGSGPGAADRGRAPGAAARDPAVHRDAPRRRRRRRRPPVMRALRPHGAHRQAAGRRPGLPDLHRALPRRAVRTLRSCPRSRHQGRPGAAGLRELHDQRSGQPPGLRELRTPPEGEYPQPGRAALPRLPAAAGAGVLGLRAEPRCRDCTVPVFPGCAACADSPRPGQCASCLLELRLRELLSGPDGGIRPSLGPLKKALAATGPPGTALRWLAKPPVAAILSGIAAGGRDLSHGELDRLEQTPVLAHLRSVLVATGTLPSRDERMARLERFTADVIDGRPDPGQRQILRRYATWHLLRRLRSRNNGRPVTCEQHDVVQQQVRGAVALLDWLDSRDLTLGTCGQAHLDEWLSGSGNSRSRDAGHFVRWAARQRLTSVSIPAVRWRGPVQALDDEARWDAARRLLHDDTINARDRLAGLLVLFYAQPVARVARLTTGHVTVSGATVHIRLGTAPITLPEPVAGLARQLLDGKRGHATTGARDPSPWLFPGGQPGRPVSSGHLGQRLKDLGIHPGQARSTALFQLASELPAALLARMLGIHINVATAWQRVPAGDWMAYAADVSRRRDQ